MTYEALVEGSGVFDPGVGAFVARGPDAVEYLQGQVAADVASLRTGEGAECLVLEPQGGLVAATTLYRISRDEVLFVCDAAVVTNAVEALNRFRVRVDVTIEAAAYDAILRVAGPGAFGAVEATFGVAPAGPLHAARAGGVVLAACSGAGLGGVYVLGEGAIPQVRDAVAVERQAVDARRVETGEPAFGVDFDASTIPHEVDLVPRAVSLTKGCYVGQERIERIHTRGNPARRLRRVRFAGADVPPVGSEVEHEGTGVGTLTTTAFCPGWGVAGGLGLLKRGVENGDAVIVEGRAGTVL